MVRAALVPVGAVIEHGHWRQHVNGYVVVMNGALLSHPQATEITDELNRAAALI